MRAGPDGPALFIVGHPWFAHAAFMMSITLRSTAWNYLRPP